MKIERGLELVTSLSQGCKTSLEKFRDLVKSLVIYHLGNFDDLIQCGF